MNSNELRAKIFKEMEEKISELEEEINANTHLVRKHNNDRKRDIGDLQLSNTAKILNQNKIVADYAELKAQITDLGERMTDLEAEKIYDPTKMKMDIRKLKEENVKKVLEEIFDILHFSDEPYKELVKKNRELLRKLYKKDLSDEKEEQRKKNKKSEEQWEKELESKPPEPRLSEDNYKGLNISLKGHYRIINNEKQRLILEFVNDLKKINKQCKIYHIDKESGLPLQVLSNFYKEKWEEKL